DDDEGPRAHHVHRLSSGDAEQARVKHGQLRSGRRLRLYVEGDAGRQAQPRNGQRGRVDRKPGNGEITRPTIGSRLDEVRNAERRRRRDRPEVTEAPEQPNSSNGATPTSGISTARSCVAHPIYRRSGGEPAASAVSPDRADAPAAETTKAICRAVPSRLTRAR